VAELDHWHPVLPSADLREAPVAVELAGQSLVLFRGTAGVGALEDCCPHRGMRLSRGKVRGDCLECPYHGWRFTPDGHGSSPGTPKLTAQASVYDVVEREGAIWVKAAGVPARFPDLGGQGHRRVAVLKNRAHAPLELVLDNFTEVEHTGQVHALFGYETSRMHEVTTRVEQDEDGVRVVNRGPQRPLPLGIGRLLGVRRSDHFIDDWTTRFSPVHVVYEHYWVDAETSERRPDGLHVAVFLNPVNDDVTDLVTFVFVNRMSLRRLPINAVLSRLLVRFVKLEVGLDVEALSHLADKRTGLRGKKLSRFDKVLGEHRRRIDREYRGR
jgi:phenylpropionate dioxygenase-like ring-hydroxylating dioxygenase large terminal subunit